MECHANFSSCYCDRISNQFSRMDFKHKNNGNNGTYSVSNNSHLHSNQVAQNHHHHLSNIEQHELYNSVKQSPQKGKLRRRCRSECLSPIPGQYHHQTHNNFHHHQQHHMERYNLRTHHHSNYYKDQDYTTKFNKYYTNMSPSRATTNSNTNNKNAYTNSYSYLADNAYDVAGWKQHQDQIKENLLNSQSYGTPQITEHMNDMDLYNKRSAHKMQVDGIKSVKFERQMGHSRYQPQEVQNDATEDGYYRNSYSYRLDSNRRYRARSESESYDLYYQQDDQFENFRNDLKRTRDAISPPMESNKIPSNKYDYKEAGSPNSIPFTRSMNNKSLTSRHSVLVNNHISNFNRFSPKLKPRSPLNSYRNKIRALTPLSKQKTVCMRADNFRHKSLSPTLLNNTSNTPISVATVSPNDSDDNADDNDADSHTLADEDCDNEDDEPEPTFQSDDTTINDEDDLTDPEDNYQASLSISNSEKSISMLAQPSAVNTNFVHGGYIDTAPLAPSLFPYVPPYITFASHDQKGPEVPAVIKKQLKWKLTTITPILVRRVLFNTGFRLIKKPNDWIGTWGKHMKSPCFKTLHSYQKFNHLPGSFQIGRKDRCWRNLQTQMSKHGKKEFGFMPRTYIIPQDLNLLRQQWHKYSQKNVKWIIKPPASARGTGIRVVNTWAQIPKRKPLIVQRYIERPLLINGSKFDLRLYVLVTSINPLRVYMHTNGLARFASVKYSERNDTLNDRYMHLTNYSINKLSNNYDKNEDENACKGHKWTIKSLWEYLRQRGIDTTRLWGSLRNLVLRTILAGEGPINAMSKVNMNNNYNCFELFGIDVLLDSELVPWLLEVNISPSLHSASSLDMAVKGPLVTALLNTVLYQVPPKIPQAQQGELLRDCGLKPPLCYDKRIFSTSLSKEERHKHNQFTQKSVAREDYMNAILDNLTPDDIRCLIITEDELARCAPLERIFPAPNSHKYLQYTESPRYYNHLVDAWEHRYHKKRDTGIALLRSLCWKRQHLKVPPTTIQKDCSDKDLNDMDEIDIPPPSSKKDVKELTTKQAVTQEKELPTAEQKLLQEALKIIKEKKEEILNEATNRNPIECDDYIEEEPIDQEELEKFKRYLSPSETEHEEKPLIMPIPKPTTESKRYSELLTDALPIPSEEGELVNKPNAIDIQQQLNGDIAEILVKQ